MPSPADLERQPVEPEGRGQDARSPPPASPPIPIAGIASRLAISPYCATVLKWKAEIGAVADPGDQRGHRDPEHRLGEPPARRGLGVQPPRPPAQRLEDGDERDRRREGHLEAGLRQALRARAPARSAPPARSSAWSAPAGRAARRPAPSPSSRRSAASRRRSRRSRGRRPPATSAATAAIFFSGQRSASRGTSASAVADHREDRRREQRHVQPGDRDDVVEARDPERRPRPTGRCRSGRRSGSPRRRRRPAPAPAAGCAPRPPSAIRKASCRQRPGVRALGLDASASGHSRPRRSARTRPAGGSRSRPAPTAPPAATSRACAEEPHARPQQVRGRRRIERDAHPRRRPRRLEPVDHHPVEQHPRPVAGRAVEIDDPPLDVRRHLVGEHRRRHQPAAQRRRRRSRRRQEQREEQRPRERPGPHRARQRRRASAPPSAASIHAAGSAGAAK